MIHDQGKNLKKPKECSRCHGTGYVLKSMHTSEYLAIIANQYGAASAADINTNPVKIPCSCNIGSGHQKKGGGI